MARRKLLIIEDEEHIANAERMVLEGDFDVHIANDGKEGIEKAHELKPEVILLDIMLPGMNGFDICKKIRANKDLSETKIIMVTAKDQQKDELEGMGLGADDYIMKPFEPIELMHVVNQVLKS
ncbi:MAG: response regulator [Nanoarchaeota archaeon]|nr:response regulator [Nanoarchaeota archaeon]